MNQQKLFYAAIVVVMLVLAPSSAFAVEKSGGALSVAPHAKLCKYADRYKRFNYDVGSTKRRTGAKKRRSVAISADEQ